MGWRSCATLGNRRQNLVIALATVTSLLVKASTDNGNMAGGMLVYQHPRYYSGTCWPTVADPADRAGTDRRGFLSCHAFRHLGGERFEKLQFLVIQFAHLIGVSGIPKLGPKPEISLSSVPFRSRD